MKKPPPIERAYNEVSPCIDSTSFMLRSLSTTIRYEPELLATFQATHIRQKDFLFLPYVFWMGMEEGMKNLKEKGLTMFIVSP